MAGICDPRGRADRHSHGTGERDVLRLLEVARHVHHGAEARDRG